MLNFLILDNKKFDYKQLFLDIESKIFQISKASLYSAKYGLTDKIDKNIAYKLMNYKGILAWKLADSDVLCEFELKDIISKIQSLIYKGGFIRPTNSLTGCTPENCV